MHLVTYFHMKESSMQLVLPHGSNDVTPRHSLWQWRYL